MKGWKHTSEQILRKLREGERLLEEGKELAEVAKVLEISEATFHRWRNQCGGMKVNDAKELRQLRAANPRQKRMVAAAEELRRQDNSGRSSKKWPRWGFGRARAVLRMKGWKVNDKRAQRLWREEGLRVPPHSPKRRRLGNSTVPTRRLQAEQRNQVWALDFMFDTTANGRPFKVLSMCDEFTRESVGGRLGRSITADDMVAVLDQLRLDRGAPEYLRCDNGPDFIAAAIRDWCCFSSPGRALLTQGLPGRTPTISTAPPFSGATAARCLRSRF
jgi:hypothetical protein